jgi:hypothetical protein
MTQHIPGRQLWPCLALAWAFGAGTAAGGPPSPKDDAGYSAKIREYTTEPCFLTELVDHLPASDTVPSPEKVLGYVVGTPERLTYTKDINRYFRALAGASPRVKVWTIGRSEGGREMLLAAVSSEANLGRLDRFKQITARLADPRKTSDAQAAELVREAKPFYWLSGSIHSPETGSPEMLMELAYRLAVEDSPHVRAIRDNLVVLITPVVEVDGRDREVDVYRYRKANPGKPAPNLIYWGKYVAHDNNRDAIGMALALSRVMTDTFLDWHPQVFHDLHESVPYLYTSTGTGPYNAWLDPLVVSEWQKLAYHEIEEMTRRGVPGVWTHGFYDGWAPNYMFYIANGHNAVGRFYETFGNGGADTRERKLPASSTSRTWYRPNPPLAKVKWSMRNNVNLQQSALLLALKYVGDRGEEFLNNFYIKSKRSVAKAKTEGPAAWVIPNDGRRPALAAQLARLLQRQGAEVHRLDGETAVKVTVPVAARERPAATGTSKTAAEPKAERPKTEKLPAGSYVVRIDQPYSRMADMLLDTQYYATADPRPYDDTGWTLGPLRNVATLRVTDPSLLDAPMTLVEGPARAPGGVEGKGTALYLIDASAEPALATLRFRLKGLKVFAAEEPFEAEGVKYHAGAFLIPSWGNPGDLRSRLDAAASTLGLKVRATDAEVKAPRHPVGVPRVALLHTWVNTQNEGWFRLALDECEVPYAYISDRDVRETPDLKARHDVILFPPSFSSLPSLIHGVRRRVLADGSDFGGPVPWRSSELTPNLGGVDETDDVRGGLGFEGLAHLKRFVEDGGVFVAVTSSAQLPVGLGMVEYVSITEPRQLQANGSVLRAGVDDPRSPIAYGYDDTVALYFNQAPVFRVALAGGRGFGGGGGGGAGGGPDGPSRTTGRGSTTDPDVPQGRPPREAEREPTLSRAERELYIDPDLREFLAGTIPPPRMWPRVVLRWADEKDLLVSGMLAGGSELAGTPAVIDVPLGRGHVVLFGNNPMWRHETHGSFMLVLNTALHHDHLHAGRREPAKAERSDPGATAGSEE